MKKLLIGLIVLGASAQAKAECKVSIHGSKWSSKKLEAILLSKGYQVINKNESADLKVSIESMGWAISDGTEAFSYSVPRLNYINYENCPYVDQWQLSCRANVHDKVTAANCMLEKARLAIPSI